jgi:poly(ADP-ribose) glycohydrolase
MASLASYFDGCSINQASSSLLNLKVVARATPDFFPELLPFIWEVALEGEPFLGDKRLISNPGNIELIQLDCLRILANAFLCRFSDRPSNNCRSGERLPSINFDELFGGPGSQSAARAKLKMILEYFRRMRERVMAGESLLRPIRFTRLQATAALAQDWLGCSTVLIPPVIEPLGQSLDDARGAIRVDFANRIIGGAAIAYGSAQEEIMFCLCPELIATRLYFPALRDDEALMLRGTEQFSLASGYGSDLTFAGRFIDSSLHDSEGLLTSWILAVDALDFRDVDRRSQYSKDSELRELNKLWAGLCTMEGPRELATGHWGCGIFGGDPSLKFLIQWAASSRAGKVLRYFPWDDGEFADKAPNFAANVTRETPTVALLVQRLFDHTYPSLVDTQ